MRVYGIAGMSCSGKSTLAEALASRHGGEAVCSDDFCFPERACEVLFEGKPFRSYEGPEVCNPAGLRAALEHLAAGTPVTVAARKKSRPGRTYRPNDLFFVEGQLLYIFPELEGLFTQRFHLDLPLELCLQRRAAREHASPYTPYFLAQGHKAYARYGLVQRSCPGVILLDATLSPEALVAIASSHL